MIATLSLTLRPRSAYLLYKRSFSFHVYYVPLCPDDVFMIIKLNETCFGTMKI